MISEESRVPLTEIRRGQILQVIVDAEQRSVATSLILCLEPLARLRGLIGRPPLARGEGLLLMPCRGVHTFFMGSSIDVAFLDPEAKVVAQRRGLRPWRMTPVFGEALATLELPPGTLDRCGVRRGVELAFHQISG